MEESGWLAFTDDAKSVCSEGTFVARLRSGIVGRAQLFDEIARVLNFPDYFGKNWDGLYDCLCDLSWVEVPVVVLMHTDFPHLDEVEGCSYLSVLRDAVASWSADRNRQLRIVFPVAAFDRVQKLVRLADKL